MFIHSKNLRILNKESDTRMFVFLGHFLPPPPPICSYNKNVEEMADPRGATGMLMYQARPRIHLKRVFFFTIIEHCTCVT